MGSESAGGAVGDWMRTGLNIYAMVIFTVLWVGFAVALIVNQDAWVDDLWNWLGELPLVVQIVVWILFLPITVGLWMWQSAWPTWLRMLVFLGIVAWTIVAITNFVRLARSS